MINEAKKFAIKKHQGKFRKDGKTPYVEHLKEVADLIKEWKYRAWFDKEVYNELFKSNNLETISWLHDTIEKTDTTKNELINLFGYKIASEIEKISYDPNKESEKQYFINNQNNIVKLADHICNTIYFYNNKLVDYKDYFNKGKNIFNNFKKYNFCRKEINFIEKIMKD